MANGLKKSISSIESKTLQKTLRLGAFARVLLLIEAKRGGGEGAEEDGEREKLK